MIFNQGNIGPKKIKPKLFYYNFSKDKDGTVFWIRFRFLYYRGFSIKNTVKLFGERNGYTKSTKLPFGYRLVWIKDKLKGSIIAKAFNHYRQDVSHAGIDPTEFRKK
jgi:hypothetical protein